jgi:hypothetical protein
MSYSEAAGLIPSFPVPRMLDGVTYGEADAQNVIAYGAQLKSWVDLQVDARVDMLFATRVEEAVLALDGVRRTELEIGAIKDMQTKLFAVVEGLSEEMGKVKAAVAANTQAKILGVVERLSNDVANLRSAVEELTVKSEELTVKSEELTVTSVATIADVGYLQSSIRDSAREIRAETRQADFVEVRMTKALEDSQEGLVGLQKRLVAELRAETVAALQSESEAIATLDQRLWKLDQRIERRLDDVAARGRERIVVETARSLSQSPHVSRSQSPHDQKNSPRSLVYSPGWNIIGGRLVSKK